MDSYLKIERPFIFIKLCVIRLSTCAFKKICPSARIEPVSPSWIKLQSPALQKEGHRFDPCRGEHCFCLDYLNAQADKKIVNQSENSLQKTQDLLSLNPDYATIIKSRIRRLSQLISINQCCNPEKRKVLQKTLSQSFRLLYPILSQNKPIQFCN